jgi:hypothetical protein
MEIKTLDQIKSQYYGEIGSPVRDKLENEFRKLIFVSTTIATDATAA